MTKITEYLEIILEGQDLTFDQAQKLLDIIFKGEVAEVQIAAFLAAMRAKKATSQEIAGLASSLRNHAVRVKTHIKDIVDTCGTGGAKVKTFNVSTAAAFVAAGAGVHVAKHGNRGITSKCGSADVLAELGVKTDCSTDLVAECIKKAKVGFMFAPLYHPAMKFVQPIRKTLDFRTAFNILGPLANPAFATAQVIGVADASLIERIAEALKLLGVKKAMVVHSDGLDEISTLGPTKIARLDGKNVTNIEIDPEELGFQLAKIEDLQGDDAPTNAKIIMDILNCRDTGPKRDIVVLNAAAAIIVSGKVKDFGKAIALAQRSISERNALDCLDKMIEVSNS